MNQEKPHRRFEKPKRIEPKPLIVLESATNQAQDVFKAGDKIQVTSPWGGKAKAEITGFYQDDAGQAWAKYTPNEFRDGWDWVGGCVLAALLMKTD